MLLKYRNMQTKMLVLVLFLWGGNCSERSTKCENKLLSRKRRYLTFPEGSNFVMTASVIKSIMVRTPRGVNMLGEMDVPFRLPSDTRIFRYQRPHHRQRREIFNQLASALDGFGLNGLACIKRMLCEADDYLTAMEESMVKDLLATILKQPTDQGDEYLNSCHNGTLMDCDVSLLNYISDIIPSYT